ncbi:MAG TPA: hypothetical protein VFC70_03440 [Oscillospiraceae bacterium]|nr:hypothetical protein [Oscillospiraceae bacterium]
MFEMDRKYYLDLSEKTGFHKDTIEKVHLCHPETDRINGAHEGSNNKSISVLGENT